MADPDLPRVPARMVTVFLVLASFYFGLAIADRLFTIASAFSSILLTIFLAWLLAFLVAPAVDVTQERLRIGRGRAIVLVYLAVLACVVGIVVATAAVGAPEAADILARSDEITARIHGLLVDAQSLLGLSASSIDLAATFDQAQRRFFSAIAGSLNAELQALASTALAVIGGLFLVVVLSLYAVIDFDGLMGGLRRVVPNRYADELELVQQSVGRAFGGFLRTQIILVILQVALTIVVGLVFGLPYLYLITIGVAVAMFVPFFGPPLALLPPLVIAVTFRSEVALPVVVLLLVGQTLLVNVLQPRLMKKHAGIHPILVLIALLLGAQIAGLWGALFGIPIVAAISLLARYVINRRVVNEVEGIELDEVVAEVRAADPEIPLDEAVSIAADRAEALEEDRSEAAKDPPTSKTGSRAG